MSEKEFRAWDNERQNYRYSFTLTNDGIVREMDSTGGIIHNVDCIVEQWTGLLDKNRVKIFEGDIVRVLYTDWISKNDSDKRTLDEYKSDISLKGFVSFNPRCGFTIVRNHNNEDYLLDLNTGTHGELEIFGNIHENPELLEAVK